MLPNGRSSSHIDTCLCIVAAYGVIEACLDALLLTRPIVTHYDQTLLIMTDTIMMMQMELRLFW